MSECPTYTVGEAAKAIGVGRSLAYELVRRGDLRTVHVGCRVLVPRDAVSDFPGPAQGQAADSGKDRWPGANGPVLRASIS
jgi:excisionase family DNA binding protein